MENIPFEELFFAHYSSFRNSRIAGRYLNLDHLEPELKRLSPYISNEVVGISESGLPIYGVEIGKGPIKILAWSQMHGNESTTTKAVLDLFNLFAENRKDLGIPELLNRCRLKIIPMLNPDGAFRYTRENAHLIDLNRDAMEQTQRESRILMEVFEKFKPDFCFNLHDQRTIFSAGPFPKPASISFLAPAFDEGRSLSPDRIKAMKIIAAINAALQPFLPSQIGRFDDSFNINCTGDFFQLRGTPTILFEAGHVQGDYMREESRKYMAFAILEALKIICNTSYENFEVASYLSIPENEKKFFDIVLKHAQIRSEKRDVAIQYQEKLKGGEIVFIPTVQLINMKNDFYGHRTINCQGGEVVLPQGNQLFENDVVATILLNKKEISFKIE